MVFGLPGLCTINPGFADKPQPLASWFLQLTWCARQSGQGFIQICCLIIWSNYSDLTRPHPKWWFSMGNGTPYFREIQVGEILFHLARIMFNPYLGGDQTMIFSIYVGFRGGYFLPLPSLPKSSNHTEGVSQKGRIKQWVTRVKILLIEVITSLKPGFGAPPCGLDSDLRRHFDSKTSQEIPQKSIQKPSHGSHCFLVQRETPDVYNLSSLGKWLGKSRYPDPPFGCQRKTGVGGTGFSLRFTNHFACPKIWKTMRWAPDPIVDGVMLPINGLINTLKVQD